MSDELTDGDQQDLRFLELCRLLNEHGVHYLICGGYACILHGNLRMTQDVDLLVEESRENYRRLIAALSLFGDGCAKELTGADIEENLVVKINDVITVDVSRRAWVVTYAEAAPNALKEVIEGVEIPYLGMKDLIRSKQTYRDKDKLDVQQLTRLAQILPAINQGTTQGKPGKGCLGILTGMIAACLCLCFGTTAKGQDHGAVSEDFTVNTLDCGGSGLTESGEFTINTLLNNSGGRGSESGEFTVDSRGTDAPRSMARSEPGDFTVDTRRFPNAMPLTINGTVVDTTGSPVRSAVVKIYQIGLEPVFVLADQLGRFSATGLVPSAYRVEVTAQFYGTGLVTVDGTRGGTVWQQVQLNPALTLVGTTPKGRAATLAEIFPTQPTNAAKLRIWNRITKVWQESGALNPSLPTVIMTHGWNSDSDVWAGPTAQAMVIELGMSGWNIVAWDWRGEAAFTIHNVINGGQFVPSDKTPAQGELLAQRLHFLLGAGYTQSLHFIGHSLGTLVNRYACDWLHKSGRWQSSATQPHLTLLDEAELSSAGGVKVLSTPLIVAQESASRLLEELTRPHLNSTVVILDAAAKATQEAVGRTVLAAIDDWKSPIPSSAAYVDNYVSLVGWNRSASANVCLAPPPLELLDLSLGHNYAHRWYRRTLEHLSTVKMGFPRSRQAGGIVPPQEPQYQAGSLWFQSYVDEFSLNWVQLESFPGACSAYALLNIAAAKKRAVVNLTVAAVEQTAKQVVKAGVVIKQTVKDAGEAANMVVKTTGEVLVKQKERFGDYVDAKVDQLVDFKNNVTADLKFTDAVARFTTRYVLLPQPQRRQARSDDGTGAASGSGVWITLDIPLDAALMAFDFGVEGNPLDDCLVAAYGGNNIFHLQGKYLVSGEIQTSDFINVSGVAGQRVEFYFGFHGGTSRASGIIEGLRFMTMPQPTLAVTQETPEEIELHWSAAASGWKLEETSDLSLAPWTFSPFPSGAILEDGVMSVRMPLVAGNKKFFRLRRFE